MMHRVKLFTGRELPMGVLLQAPTIARLAQLIEGRERTPASSMLVCMREGTGRPLYLVHGLSGTVMECWKLVRELRTDRPVWGLQARGIDGEQPPQSRVEDMAALYVAQLRCLQPSGPYALCGFSFGGLVALEMGRRLWEEGDSVDFLCLLDPQLHQDFSWGTRVRLRSARAARKLARLPAREVGGWIAGSVARAVRHGHRAADRVAMSSAQQGVQQGLEQALERYRPLPYAGSPVLYLQAQIPLEGYFDPMPVWRRIATGGLQVVDIAGTHLELVGAHAQQVAAVISSYLA
jgi:acetoacetyl-CoA synthetase